MRWFFSFKNVNNLLKKSTVPTFAIPVLLLQFAWALQGNLATKTQYSQKKWGGGLYWSLKISPPPPPQQKILYETLYMGI